MPRKPRFVLPGVPQHIIQRGNNREPCFYSAEHYRRYLELLKEAADRNDCCVHAYVLMTNHVHVLATPFSPHGVSHLMQDLGRKYVRAINHIYRRSGTLWEGRYKASLVDSEAYLLACMRYIELNPVRANMVVHPGEYRWSSYAANGQGQADALISPHPLYEQLGHDPLERQRLTSAESGMSRTRTCSFTSASKSRLGIVHEARANDLPPAGLAIASGPTSPTLGKTGGGGGMADSA